MSRKLGLFRLGSFGYAVPLDRILRVVDCGFCTILPLISDRMAGMLVLDDEVIPVLDSNWLSGVAAGHGLSADFKILITTEVGTVALPADMTVGIVAENRYEQVATDQEPTEFFPESICYRNNRYRVLNVDVFMHSLIRP
jgi:chemotaxis signal transduction protein